MKPIISNFVASIIASSLLIIGFTACATHKAVKPSPPKGIVREDYVIQPTGRPGQYYVWIKSSKPQVLAKAKAEIGCGICTQSEMGYVVVIEHIKPKE